MTLTLMTSEAKTRELLFANASMHGEGLSPRAGRRRDSGLGVLGEEVTVDDYNGSRDAFTPGSLI